MAPPRLHRPLEEQGCSWISATHGKISPSIGGKIVESLIEKLSKNKLKYGIFSELLRECQKNCSIDKEKFLKTNGVKLRHCEKATKFEKISLLF